MKYSNPYGNITLSLYQSERKVEFMISNTVDQVPQGNLDRLFERFYLVSKYRLQILHFPN